MFQSEDSSAKTFDTLGTLLLAPSEQSDYEDSWFARGIEYVSNLDQRQFQNLLSHANTQRVLRRILEVLKRHLPSSRQEGPIADLIQVTLTKEKERAERALAYLREIVTSFEERGHPIMVMKTLDHWPDTGSDLDLLVTADDREVCHIFEKDFRATREHQSWGDRLAHKFNFRIPGLPELVELHVGCLGQTGEQRALAVGALFRRAEQAYGKYVLPVPAVEDRVAIATLQRMYRHYYIRLTDIVNIFGLLAQERINFDRLKAIAESGAIWEGVATLMVIVRQHGIRCGGDPVTLPDSVASAAQFTSGRTYLGRNFVRVPLVPEAAKLFLRQLAGNGRRRNFRAMLRMTLLPMLATAAFVSFRVTGDDKGVW